MNPVLLTNLQFVISTAIFYIFYEVLNIFGSRRRWIL